MTLKDIISHLERPYFFFEGSDNQRTLEMLFSNKARYNKLCISFANATTEPYGLYDFCNIPRNANTEELQAATARLKKLLTYLQSGTANNQDHESLRTSLINLAENAMKMLSDPERRHWYDYKSDNSTPSIIQAKHPSHLALINKLQEYVGTLQKSSAYKNLWVPLHHALRHNEEIFGLYANSEFTILHFNAMIKAVKKFVASTPWFEPIQTELNAFIKKLPNDFDASVEPAASATASDPTLAFAVDLSTLTKALSQLKIFAYTLKTLAAENNVENNLDWPSGFFSLNDELLKSLRALNIQDLTQVRQNNVRMYHAMLTELETGVVLLENLSRYLFTCHQSTKTKLQSQAQHIADFDIFAEVLQLIDDDILKIATSSQKILTWVMQELAKKSAELNEPTPPSDTPDNTLKELLNQIKLISQNLANIECFINPPKRVEYVDQFACAR